MIRLAILFAVTSLLATASTAATISDLDDATGSYIIYLRGEIVFGDYERLVRIIVGRNAFPKHMMVISPGGDAYEAMKIGRLSRKGLMRITTVELCNSACALIVFGSVFNFNEGELGLHRPIFTKQAFAKLPIDEARVYYKKLSKDVEAYLSELGVPKSIGDKMMAVPSDRILMISRNSYRQLAGKRPAAYDEWLKARCGSLPKDESHDFGLVVALNNYQALKAAANHWESDWPLELEYEKDALLALELSEGYRKYLLEKGQEITKCEDQSIAEEQSKLVVELRNSIEGQ